MRSITPRGTGSAPTLAVHDPSNIFVLFTNTTILHIGCSDTQTPKIREALKNIFRPCSVIASCEVSRKKNKFQWVKNFLVVLTSRDFLLYENEKYVKCFANVIPLRLDSLFFRLSPTEPSPSVQLLTGTEQNYKAQIEVKFGDKTLLLSTGSSPSSSLLALILIH